MEWLLFITLGEKIETDIPVNCFGCIGVWVFGLDISVHLPRQYIAVNSHVHSNTICVNTALGFGQPN